MVVPSNEAFTPLPATGLPLVRSGGQAVAQAPVHALVVPESFLNRYRVRPCESTRIFPRPLFATRTAVGGTLAGFAEACEPAVALLPPPPQAARDSAASGTAAAAAMRVMGLLRIMLAPLVR